MKFSVLDSGAKSASENMALDQRLLKELSPSSGPLVHLYDWQAVSATYGHFVDPSRFFLLEAVGKRGLDLARRPTGGGVLFHNSDLAFSLLMPASDPRFSQDPLANYAFVHERVKRAIERFTSLKSALVFECAAGPRSLERFCMARATKYDLVIEGKKVAGAAQRKTKEGYLHQGSIFLGLASDDFYRELVQQGDLLLAEMKKNSFPLLGSGWTTKQLKEARRSLKEHLREVFLEKE